MFKVTLTIRFADLASNYYHEQMLRIRPKLTFGCFNLLLVGGLYRPYIYPTSTGISTTFTGKIRKQDHCLVSSYWFVCNNKNPGSIKDVAFNTKVIYK